MSSSFAARSTPRPPTTISVPSDSQVIAARTCSENRVAVRFAYEYRDDSGTWFRAYGNENWQFDEEGLMARRIASINEHPITEAERKFRWPLGRRPGSHPGLSELEL